MKIKVGQVWSYRAINIAYRITAIRGNHVLAVKVRGGLRFEDEREVSFGFIRDDGSGLDWSSGWVCQVLSAEEQAAIDDQQRRLEHAMKYL